MTILYLRRRYGEIGCQVDKPESVLAVRGIWNKTDTEQRKHVDSRNE